MAREVEDVFFCQMFVIHITIYETELERTGNN